MGARRDGEDHSKVRRSSVAQSEPRGRVGRAQGPQVQPRPVFPVPAFPSSRDLFSSPLAAFAALASCRLSSRCPMARS